MKFAGIIPARYQSTRFPGKPLAMIKDKPMIQWVYENASKALDLVWVATDDDRIIEAIEAFGGKVVKTLPTHQSGTDRCAEAARIVGENAEFDVVINIQGDEPFIKPEQIEVLKNCFQDGDVELATLVKKIESEEELLNPNRPKVVVDNKQNALYFSRSPIPYFRGENNAEWHLKHSFWAHIGLYAFRVQTLQELTQLKQTPLELAESLEQLRWLENGYKIKTAETTFRTIGIDTPEDLDAALQLF
ncbi:3-deoxy-manno-octulosonate cytidylyltransferase [Maribellus mangrovi]|uniref:3-deoxy-manno-octulosonate cytidylyltransferase n=1 Tax=Maribellus mangrovi TaxID=3133146 RepID=UPI0030ECCBC6